jgi:hypothetical protein
VGTPGFTLGPNGSLHLSTRAVAAPIAFRP